MVLRFVQGKVCCSYKYLERKSRRMKLEEDVDEEYDDGEEEVMKSLLIQLLAPDTLGVTMATHQTTTSCYWL